MAQALTGTGREEPLCGLKQSLALDDSYTAPMQRCDDEGASAGNPPREHRRIPERLNRSIGLLYTQILHQSLERGAGNRTYRGYCPIS
jgi:hypothetical protein